MGAPHSLPRPHVRARSPALPRKCLQLKAGSAQAVLAAAATAAGGSVVARWPRGAAFGGRHCRFFFQVFNNNFNSKLKIEVEAQRQLNKLTFSCFLKTESSWCKLLFPGDSIMYPTLKTHPEDSPQLRFASAFLAPGGQQRASQSWRPLEQTPRQSLDAGRIHGHSLPSTQSEQITPIVSFSHLQPQGHT
ncbi:chromosome transmission fidelity protein 8 homolog isoform X1 [Ursus maritimus]|uniref:Chromosome transmission fidelity protein 8 homolog isoform X1 n=1 Tax=Ursus maritimus TaxID=29073 RepID=A0A8M1GBN7_URSMA|nr:chromosome transmission fidelity protein 8 homolog isoform X1 [Ursus maritimus]